MKRENVLWKKNEDNPNTIIYWKKLEMDGVPWRPNSHYKFFKTKLQKLATMISHEH